MFIHHVFFWLKNPDSITDRNELIAGLQLLSKAGAIQRFHIGLPAATDRAVIERGYAVSWLLEFATAADEEQYQTDPIHLHFIESCAHLWNKVVVYDSVDAV